MSGESTSPAELKRSSWIFTTSVFLAAAAAVWALWANRFFLSLDEGIYLAGAERILRGQVPYRDFFVLIGPGSFWIQAGLLGLLGPTLRHARLALAFDLGLMTAGVYWLTDRLSGRAMALVAAAAFFALETRPLFRLYVNHRWDSSAFGLLAVVLVFAATEHPRFCTFFAAGVVAAAAAWVTPSLLAVVILLSLWLVLIRELRGQLIPYLLGIAFVSVVAAGVLLLQGALVPMFRDLLWTAGHYPGANRVPYGYGAIPPGGLSAVFAGAPGAAAWIARATGLMAVLLPPVLPVAVYAGWLVRRLRRRPMDQREKLATLLVIASFGFIFSTYPRWSADQLLFIAPIFYVLAAFLLHRFVQSKALLVTAGVCVLAVAAAALSYSMLHISSETAVKTRVGMVRTDRAGGSILKLADSRIGPGDSLFVYPYLPVIYFLTGARNPTRYSFLQPGMMQGPAYQETLRELRANPPQWVFYFALSLATYHGIWPAANPAALNLTPVDDFIISHYHPVGILQASGTKFFLLAYGAH